MNRRTALKLTAGFGLAGGGWYRFMPPGPSRVLDSVDALAQRLHASLDADQRADTCVSYEHPLRQYHNRGVPGGGRGVFFGFDHAQRQILTDLFYAGLSDEGRRRVPREYFTRWGGVQTMRVLICGDPTAPPYQVILTGAHLNLRLGGKSREGAAFGGPQVYGDQRGDRMPGLPGNLYRDQFLVAERILRELDDGRRKQAVLDEAPVQTQIELQGRGGTFAGIPVAELRSDGKALVGELVERVLAIYPANDVTYARECLAEGGGLDALFLSYYRQSVEGDIPEAQVFRLEGPGAVFYFRGHPHVHAFVNLSPDGDAPLSVGEPLGRNPAWLERTGVKALFEAALSSATGADLAYYDEGSVAGRLRPGIVRSGDIYALESWQERVAVVDVRGSNLSAALLAQLRERGLTVDPVKTYSVAATHYVAKREAEKLGPVEARRPGPMLRDATVDYVRAHGIPTVSGPGMAVSARSM
jgi:hypothetical protein